MVNRLFVMMYIEVSSIVFYNRGINVIIIGGTMFSTEKDEV